MGFGIIWHQRSHRSTHTGTQVFRFLIAWGLSAESGLVNLSFRPSTCWRNTLPSSLRIKEIQASYSLVEWFSEDLNSGLSKVSLTRAISHFIPLKHDLKPQPAEEGHVSPLHSWCRRWGVVPGNLPLCTTQVVPGQEAHGPQFEKQLFAAPV